jgi:hypothetical protein
MSRKDPTLERLLNNIIKKTKNKNKQTHSGLSDIDERKVRKKEIKQINRGKPV